MYPAVPSEEAFGLRIQYHWTSIPGIGRRYRTVEHHHGKSNCESWMAKNMNDFENDQFEQSTFNEVIPGGKVHAQFVLPSTGTLIILIVHLSKTIQLS